LGRRASSTERRFRAEIREALDIGNHFLFFSVFVEVIEIPEKVRVKCVVWWPF
jgi:hypothetical protein